MDTLKILRYLFCMVFMVHRVEGKEQRTLHNYIENDPDNIESLFVNDPRHGNIRMGIPNNACDNGKDGIEVDWDPSSDEEYRCKSLHLRQNPFMYHHQMKRKPSVYCTDFENLPEHKCMGEAIHYKEKIPLSGPHRPLWPVYGDYQYCPPQRWLHTVEHGAAVFLYNPCADSEEISLFKKVAEMCIRKHIITPYQNVPQSEPFVVVTYMCRLSMTHVDIEAASTFIKQHALKSPERNVWEDGQYNVGLIRKSPVVSDLQDSVLCPYSYR